MADDGIMYKYDKMLKKPMLMSASGAVTIDCENAPCVRQHMRIAGDVTSLDVTNFERTFDLLLMIEQDAVGGHTVTFAAKFNAKGRAQTAAALALDSWWFMVDDAGTGLHLHALEQDVR